MALELYYTSAPRGLRPGSSGLCTVAMTRTMSAALAARLESLCGYRPPGGSVPIDAWPVALSHWILDVGGVERHILASVRPVPPDHTMRSNTLAHFVVLHQSELDAAGAVWMIDQPETSAVSWSGEPCHLDEERAVPRGGPRGARRAATWEATAGDAGWAGVLANAAVLDPSRPLTVIYPASVRVLDLAAEAMSLVPPAHRWRVTFTTYFAQPIAGVRCTWRFCLDGTSAATSARRGGGLVIDACIRQPCNRRGAFIDAARSGKEPVLTSAVKSERPRVAQLVEPTVARTVVAAPSTPDLETGPTRRVPVRMPVGADELAQAPSSGGRTTRAATVVVGTVLLTVIAVLVVIMRAMVAQSAELQARVVQLQERIATLEASSAAMQVPGVERKQAPGGFEESGAPPSESSDDSGTQGSGPGPAEPPQFMDQSRNRERSVPRIQDSVHADADSAQLSGSTCGATQAGCVGLRSDPESDALAAMRGAAGVKSVTPRIRQSTCPHDEGAALICRSLCCWYRVAAVRLRPWPSVLERCSKRGVWHNRGLDAMAKDAGVAQAVACGVCRVHRGPCSRARALVASAGGKMQREDVMSNVDGGVSWSTF